MAMIYTFGNISGALFNPAVAIGFILAKKIETQQTLLYILSQTLGAFLASFTLKFLFPENLNLSATHPA
jgi:aquaporin Z